MANMKFFAYIVVMCMVVLSAQTSHAITCGQISSNLVSCITYLRSGGPVPRACCAGIGNIVAIARTTADRRTACTCLKTAAASVRGLNPSNAESLPRKCGVNIPYKISTSTNCASIK